MHSRRRSFWVGAWLACRLLVTAEAEPLSPAERERLCEAHIRDSLMGVCAQVIAADDKTALAARREQQGCVFPRASR